MIVFVIIGDGIGCSRTAFQFTERLLQRCAEADGIALVGSELDRFGSEVDRNDHFVLAIHLGVRHEQHVVTVKLDGFLGRAAQVFGEDAFQFHGGSDQDLLCASTV